jgi:S-DNA-T family DNA segregation ATPase FtsK/SpoIIIE
MEAQVARLDVEAIRRRPRVPRVERVGTLPAVLDPTQCPRARRRDGMLSLPIGARFDDLTDARLEVADGEHVLVIGPGRSGRSTALVRVVQAWSTAVPDGWVGVVAPRRSPLSSLGREAAEVVAEVPTTGDALLVVDDAELVDDPSGSLARLVAARRAGLLIVVAGRPDALRAAYGHWSTGIRRSRLGIVMTGATDMDADLLGASLPRWPPLAARPGLGYVVADGTETLVQCAIDAAATPPSSSRRSAPARPRPLVAVS